MEIEIDGRLASIEREWDRSRVQDALLKSCLSLTRIDIAPGQTASVVNSLATCFIQHLSGHYRGFSNLSEVWGSSSIELKCTEEEWIQFRLQLKSEKTERLDVINKIFDTFKWFQLIPHPFKAQFVCLGSKLGKNVNEIHCTQHDVDESATFKSLGPYYLWFDEEMETFYGIVKWGETFNDPQVYRMALMCQLTQSLKDFFLLQLKKYNASDDELEKGTLKYLDDINKQCDNRSIENNLSMLEKWDADAMKGGLEIMLGELLHPNFDSNRYDIERELRQELIESLERASEELRIEHLENYERARLQAIESRQEDERQDRQERKSQIEIQATAGEVIDRLQRELDEQIAEMNESQAEDVEKNKKVQARDRWKLALLKLMQQKKSLRLASSAELLIQQKRQELNEKKDQLDWNRFCFVLGKSHSSYDLARSGRHHKFFQSDNYPVAFDLVETVIKEFDLAEPFRQQNGNFFNLSSYTSKRIL